MIKVLKSDTHFPFRSVLASTSSWRKHLLLLNVPPRRQLCVNSGTASFEDECVIEARLRCPIFEGSLKCCLLFLRREGSTLWTPSQPTLPQDSLVTVTLLGGPVADTTGAEDFSVK